MERDNLEWPLGGSPAVSEIEDFVEVCTSLLDFIVLKGRVPAPFFRIFSRP